MYKTPPPDPAVLAEYEALPPGTTPRSVQEAALFARNEEDATILARGFTGDRQGYANNLHIPNAEAMAAAALHSDQAEADDGEEKTINFLGHL